jgi:hypothetical protein
MFAEVPLDNRTVDKFAAGAAQHRPSSGGRYRWRNDLMFRRG